MAVAGSTGAVGPAMAPVVEVEVGADRRATAPLAGLPALAGGAFAAWALALAGLPPALQAAGAGCAAAALGAGSLWWLRNAALRPARLRWDGSGWTWAAAAPDAVPLAGTLHLIWDFDGWLLLRFDGADRRRRWAALSRRSHGSRWHALRCAILAHGRAQTLALPPGARV